jgi:ADP-heptose:LPS heptosyltransferase
LLYPLGLTEIPTIQEVQRLTAYFKPIEQNLPSLFQQIDLSNAIILHPKSKGSALEWPLNSYMELSEKVIDLKTPVLFTGTEEEGKTFRHLIPKNPFVIDTTGQLSLEELIFLISKAKGLVACSTGPYHIAGLCNRRAVGLFSSRKPIHPGRWHALGKNSAWLTFDNNCSACLKGKKCVCIEKIPVSTVLDVLLQHE